MKINLMLAYNFCSLGLIFVLKKNNFFFHFNRTAEPDQSILITKMKKKRFFPARRPLAAGDAGLETGYPEKICHHDDVRRRTTDKKSPP